MQAGKALASYGKLEVDFLGGPHSLWIALADQA